MPAELLRALDEAARTTSNETSRQALTRLQLRGKGGEVVTTDGRQLLVHSGFSFPWADKVLVPHTAAFGCRELLDEVEVGVGRTQTHVAVRAGPWTVLLPIDSDSRYPDVDVVIPRPGGAKTRLELDAEDARFLATALPKPPGDEGDTSPITLDLGEPPAVRARAESHQRPVEVLLARSRVHGPAVLAWMDRRLLHRALKLGFRDLEIVRPDTPVVCRDPSRTYLWMTLDKSCALPRGGLAPANGPVDPAAALKSKHRQAEYPIMPVPQPNGAPKGRDGTTPESWSLEEGIVETEALRGLLQEASGRTARLLAALKHQRRQSRAVKAATDSLRQLQLDG